MAGHRDLYSPQAMAMTLDFIPSHRRKTLEGFEQRRDVKRTPLAAV